MCACLVYVLYAYIDNICMHIYTSIYVYIHVYISMYILKILYRMKILLENIALNIVLTDIKCLLYNIRTQNSGLP